MESTMPDRRTGPQQQTESTAETSRVSEKRPNDALRHVEGEKAEEMVTWTPRKGMLGDSQSASIMVPTNRDPVPDGDHFEVAWSLLEELFEPISEAIRTRIERRIIRECWTVSELDAAVDHILATKSSYVIAGDRKPSIAPSDIRRQTPMLHGPGWRRQRLAEDPTASARIRKFVRADGVEGYGWREEMTDFLAKGVVGLYHPSRRPALPESLPDPPPPEVRHQIDLLSTALEIDRKDREIERLHGKLLEAKKTIEQQAETLRGQLGRIVEAQQVADQLGDIVTSYRQIVADMMSGELTVEGLKRKAAEAEEMEVAA